MTLKEQQAYNQGQKSIYLRMLDQALAGLGIRDPNLLAAKFVSERAEIVALLRMLGSGTV